MLSTGERPRELHWYHAGPMLFGDWGTSRLYVLGLAFAFTGRASFWFVAAMCVLMIGVGWSYTTVCRLFPDGGGVYSAARQRSQLLAVVGVLLLCADYVVTASLSCLDAFHYIGLKDVHFLGLPMDALATVTMILLIGVLNIFGPSKAGLIAMFVALATIVLTMIIAVFCLPHLNPTEVRLASPLSRGPRQAWIGFTEIVLALSGVEAVANMTGIMVQPVEKTARRTILPVLIEIVILNLILAAAMNALPDSILNERTPNGELAHTGDMLKVIAHHFVDPVIPHFSDVAAVVFAFLLLSAVNTALGALVSVQFMLSRDQELPKVFSGLNRFGMPQLPLVIAAIVPALVVLLFPRVEALADLYAIGVVGAIAINMGSISTNRSLEIKNYERALMLLLTAVLIAIELTIAIVKPHARSFALVVLVIGLAGRLATIVSNKAAGIPTPTRNRYLALAGSSVALILGLAFLNEVHATLFGVGSGTSRWNFHVSDLAFLASLGVAGSIGYASARTQTYHRALMAAEVAAHEEPTAPSRPKMLLPGAYTPKYRIMVPTLGNPRLLDFAFQECKVRQAELQVLYVKLLAVTPMGPMPVPTLAEDEEARGLFERLRARAKDEGVPLRLLYGVASDIPDAILDMTITHGADLLLMGISRRGTMWKAMKGDVIQAVAELLPEQVGLMIYA